ncbi:MAG: hypothetical protein AABY32_05945 [Nanoarchaeota archaeon]
MAGKKKRIVRRKSPVKSKSSISSQRVIFSKVKLGLVLRNLVLFVLLFLISFILSLVSGGVWIDIFDFLWIIFGFISVAFFLALLVLLFMKLIRK